MNWRGRKCLSVSISPLSLHFISLSPFPISLHFLILSPFPRSTAATLPQVVTGWVQMILIQGIKVNLNMPGLFSGHVHLAKGRINPCSRKKAEEQIFYPADHSTTNTPNHCFCHIQSILVNFWKKFSIVVKRNSYHGNMKPSKEA